MSKKRKKHIITWTVIALVLLVAGWFSFGPGISNHAPKERVITIGVVGESNSEQVIWQHVAQKAKRDYGIIIKTKVFTDYNQPNKALRDGEIDLNAIQTTTFMHTWSKANHAKIVSIGKTYIAPIRLYSKKYHKLSQLPQGATIAIPNDAATESRALHVLKNAGLISLTSGQKLKTIADITANPQHIKIKEVSDEQCARIINSVDAVIVNNDFAVPAGLGPKETIFVEPINKESAGAINNICTTEDKKNDPDYQHVVKCYQTEETKKLYHKFYGEMQQAVWDVKLK
ncbi:MetQ/NlpA family ABC transporter substrate-binding protein [Lactobacillus sp. ESL0679]|uniref:MetQ/NlpA family ABC transporter substrate-binding protein n=1 Tax=unclassified Lactobacillus TaxID=2620435 RepID=UPI0023F9EAA8|nr:MULTISPECIES: MetQ/NlpA family ABC transporter substrate-binding protein [unclassified Lactobacillus]MDF7683124.1 MetQ/NlpA family ABC transporter substrate-binding protein [Lactobacillus sp. ESL0679]WEV36397.1 MetQ/NlpA family ABC transporter substrate-binding protein [Lactobacillus sp. ESL0677]